MKTLLSALLILITTIINAQTFEVVQKGYYNGIVGDSVLQNRTTQLKALTDVQNYLEANNMSYGEVRGSFLVVTRKTLKPVIVNDTIRNIITVNDTIRNTITVNDTLREPILLISNSYMGPNVYNETINLVKNGTFDSNDYWSQIPINGIIANGKFSTTGVTSHEMLRQNNVVEIGKKYKITMDLVSTGSGLVIIREDNINAVILSGTGTVTGEWTVTKTTQLQILLFQGWQGTIDNIIVEKID